jgi:hypothetical protein
MLFLSVQPFFSPISANRRIASAVMARIEIGDAVNAEDHRLTIEHEARLAASLG